MHAGAAFLSEHLYVRGFLYLIAQKGSTVPGYAACFQLSDERSMQILTWEYCQNQSMARFALSTLKDYQCLVLETLEKKQTLFVWRADLIGLELEQENESSQEPSKCENEPSHETPAERQRPSNVKRISLRFQVVPNYWNLQKTMCGHSVTTEPLLTVRKCRLISRINSVTEAYLIRGVINRLLSKILNKSKCGLLIVFIVFYNCENKCN